MAGKIANFMAEAAELLSEIAKIGDRRISLELVDLLADPSFGINIFKLYIENLPCYKYRFSRRTSKIIKSVGFHRDLVRGGSTKKMVMVLYTRRR